MDGHVALGHGDVQQDHVGVMRQVGDEGLMWRIQRLGKGGQACREVAAVAMETANVV